MISLDISKINNQYQLLTVFLLATESLLGYLAYKSDESIERIILGSIMAIILITFLVIFNKIKSKEYSPINIGKDSEEKSEQSITQDDFENKIPSPDKDYAICEPEGKWDIEVIKPSKLSCEIFQIKIPWFKENLRNYVHPSSQLLTFKSPESISVTSIPGKSKMNGQIDDMSRKFNATTTMTIIPMERVQSQFYHETKFPHNRIKLLSELMRQGFHLYKEVEQKSMPKSNRKYVQYELRQKWDNVQVNGVLTDSLLVNLAAIAIQGSIKDYLFLIRYSSGNLSDSEKTRIRNNIGKLCNTIDTVTIFKNPDLEKKQIDYKHKADELHQLYTNIHSKKNLFENVFADMMKIINKTNLSDPVKIDKFIPILKNVEKIAKENELHYRDIDDLWDVLDNSEEGNYSNLVTNLLRLREEWNQWTKTPENAKQVDILFE